MARQYTITDKVREQRRNAGNALKSKVNHEYYRFIGRLGGCMRYKLHLLERAGNEKNEAVRDRILSYLPRYEVVTGNKVLVDLFVGEVSKGKRKTLKQLEAKHRYHINEKIPNRFERNQAIRAARAEYDRELLTEFHAGLPVLGEV